MRLIQMFDSHWRDEEPFFVAAEAMLQRLPREIAGIASGESFILVHGGDVFHRSKETGRVNGVALRFFMSVLAIPGCQAIYIIQGNHDVKKETGSALDFFLGIDNRLKIIKKPELIPLWDGKYLYALPHMPAYALENFKGITSYGDAEFHAPYLGDNIDNVAVTVCHFGDETAGDFFKQADISFLPGIMCNGHIHKRVSDHYPGSIGITRRDEVNKISYLRVFENGLDKYADIAISCAFNYLKINFGDDVLKSYESMEVKPYGSLIVDVQGHDDESAALLWFDEQKKSLSIPAFLGSVYPDEKQSNGEYELDDSSESKKFDIKVIFAEFCKEKGVDRNVQGKIEALL